MAKKNGKSSFKDLLMKAFKAKDADEIEKLAKQAESEDEESDEDRAEREAKEKEAEKDKKTSDSLAKIMDKLKSMDEDMKEMKKAMAEDEDEGEDDDDPDMTGDEGDLTEAETAQKLDAAGVKLYTGDSAKAIPSLAEILAPGTKIPTMDGKTTDAQRAQALCSCQRRALDKAYKTEDGRAVISPFLGGHKANFKTMPAALVNAAFIGASNLMKAKNNDQHQRVRIATTDFGKTTDAATLNAKNREFWNKRSGSNH